jgi:hypothetical protein
VLIYDGYTTLPSGKYDALILRIVAYGPPRRELEMVIPYRPSAHAAGFAVHRPKFTAMRGVDDDALAPITDAFFTGVDAHDQGAKVWNAHIDQSV